MGGHCAKGAHGGAGARRAAAAAHRPRQTPRVGDEPARQRRVRRAVEGVLREAIRAARTFDQFGGAAMLKELGYAEGQPSARVCGAVGGAVATPFPTEAPSSSCVFMTAARFGTCPASAASRGGSMPQVELPARRRRGGGRRGRAARRARAVPERARRAVGGVPAPLGGRWGATRVLDKLNVLGAPFGRVVWLDDALVRRSVDELCLPPNVSFAAAERRLPRVLRPERRPRRRPSATSRRQWRRRRRRRGVGTSSIRR